MSVNELAVLQAVRMKGRVAAAGAAVAVGGDEAEVAEVLGRAVAAGDAVERAGQYRLSPTGREKLDGLLAEEREGLDAARISALYDEFTAVNADFKQVATDWQQQGDEPNDHADAAYDRSVLDRLVDGVHPRLAGLLPRLVDAAPRLAPYAGRFENALRRIQAGETTWLLHPLIDSYHTVWFELHEDLIGLAGHARDVEAAAGRAS